MFADDPKESTPAAEKTDQSAEEETKKDHVVDCETEETDRRLESSDDSGNDKGVGGGIGSAATSSWATCEPYAVSEAGDWLCDVCAWLLVRSKITRSIRRFARGDVYVFTSARRLGKGGRAAAHASLAGGLALTQLSPERSALAAFGAASVAWRLQRVTSTSSASSGDLGF